jgi:hypothetical protein
MLQPTNRGSINSAREARGPRLVLLLSLLGTAGLIITGFRASAARAAAPKAQSQSGAESAASKPDATLVQLMRGIMFPDSNAIFAGQQDVSKVPRAATPDKSTDPITGMFGGWQAVENASLALAESSDLLLKTGRICANGRPVPVSNPDWAKFVSRLHDASLDAYKAAQAKNTDDMVDAADEVAQSCIACHNVYGSNRASQAHCVAAPPVQRPAPPSANP